jgi:hypothetical protein
MKRKKCNPDIEWRNIIRGRWKSINTEQKFSLIGILIGIFMVVYAFESKYGLYIGLSGYILTMFCSVSYELLKYFPILKKSKQRIPQKTLKDYI